MLLRRLFQICQNGPVTEYIDQFVALVDELKAYAKHPDPLYYTQRFIDGLHDEIKAVVLVQRPSTLDTACILAQLQEEAMGAIKRPYRRVDVLPGQKPAWPAPLPLPPPPPKLAIVDAPRVTEVTRVQLKKNSGHFVPLVVPVGRGLCIRCRAKWSREHKCSEVVQLHLVQELLDMFPDMDDAETSSPPSPAASQVMMHLSVAAIAGASAPKTLCLTGSIQGISLSILVDSGSSHTFLSSSLAQSLSGIQELHPTVSV